MTLKAIGKLFTDAFDAWGEDRAARMGAALAYYTIFSLAPLLIIVIAVAGLAFGQAAAQGQIVQEIQGFVGVEGAQSIQAMLEKTRQPAAGIIATVLGFITLLIGATGVVGELKDALNTIWKVKPEPGSSVMSMVKSRLISLAMVLGIGFLLLVSLIASAALSAVHNYLSHVLVHPGFLYFWQAVNFVVSLGVITVLFAMIYRFLPDITVAWGDVWIGASLTALLFVIGKVLIGLYLGKRSISSAYGPAGSLVLILVWIYYSAQILFYGAEFTRVYAHTFGSRAHSQEQPGGLVSPLYVASHAPHTSRAMTSTSASQEGPARLQASDVPALTSVASPPLQERGRYKMAVLGFVIGMFVGSRRRARSS